MIKRFLAVGLCLLAVATPVVCLGGSSELTDSSVLGETWTRGEFISGERAIFALHDHPGSRSNY